LRSFEARDVKWAVAAGAAAALAMLGKYYSVFLIASFVVAALCQKRSLVASSAGDKLLGEQARARKTIRLYANSL